MGHLFVVPGDLRHLACDAWLLPCDAKRKIMSYWRDGASQPLGDLLDRVTDLELPANWGPDGERVLKPEWRTIAPQPWLVNTGADEPRLPEWFTDGVRLFIDAASTDIRQSGARRMLPKRAKPLLGVPLVGTGGGGAHRLKPAVLRSIVDAIRRAASDNDVDVALVLKSPQAFSAAQAARREVLSDGPSLGPLLDGAIATLATKAREGSLVVFFGAGVSSGAGLPGWDALIEGLLRHPDVNITEEQRAAIADRSLLDKARLAQVRLDLHGKHIGEVVKEQFTGEVHSLVHAQLAALPVDEFVTTNYDQLFELASNSAGRALRVLPRTTDARRWLLKLHGSIDDPRSIVLTREDYLRFPEQRQALAGIVQAMLLTKHMLFVGYSLDDDSFHRIADDVRKVMRGDATSPMDAFGTALMPSKNVLEDLWEPEINCIALGDGTDDAAAFRTLEIALDKLVAAASSSVGHLLDPDFERLLTEEDAELANELRKLGSLRAARSGSPTWQGIERLLTSLGYRH